MGATGDSVSQEAEMEEFDVFENAEYPASSYREDQGIFQEYSISEKTTQLLEEMANPYAPASILYRAECRVSMTPREVSHCLVGYKEWPQPALKDVPLPKSSFPINYYSEPAPVPIQRELQREEKEPETPSFVPLFTSITQWIQQLNIGCCWNL